MGPMGDAIPCLPQPHCWLHLVEITPTERTCHWCFCPSSLVFTEVKAGFESFDPSSQKVLEDLYQASLAGVGCEPSEEPGLPESTGNRLSTAAMDLCLAETCKRSFRVSHGGRGRDRDKHTDTDGKTGPLFTA